jgi:hypothetical protein
VRSPCASPRRRGDRHFKPKELEHEPSRSLGIYI